MEKRSILLGLVISVLLITNISAGIYFSQSESYYNLGDSISVEVSVAPILEGFLKVDLVCDGGIVNVFNGVPNEEGIINIQFPLTFSYIDENSGDCYFLGEYFGLSQQSSVFEISKALDVRLDIDNLVAKPNEEIVISGTAKRLNGVGINGEVELNIPLLEVMNFVEEELEEIIEEGEAVEEEVVENTEEVEEEIIEEEVVESVLGNAGVFRGKVVDGVFSVNFKLKEDTDAGNYRIDVSAYERDSLEKITSEGLAMANLQVLQILTGIDIALNSQGIDPGQNLEFKPMLIDQTGQPITEEVSIIIRDDDLNRIFEQILQSEDTFQYLIPSNFTSGYYEVEASSGDFSMAKKFYVNEKAIALFEMVNSSLIVTNVGNIPYDKDIQVELNGKPFVREVDLDLGEKQEFKLTGDGEFNVKVSDGETEISHEGVVLTGNAINVEAVKKGFIALNTPIIWIFFIVVLGAGVLFFFRNILKKKSFAYPIREKFKNIRFYRKKPLEIKSDVNLKDKKLGDKNSIDKYVSKEPKIFPAPLITPNRAEQVLVLNGHKNKAAVFVLKIKNKLNKKNKADLNEMIQSVHTKKGAIYESGDYLIAVFSPLMTRSYRNEIIAAKSAELIQNLLKDYNKKFIDKIKFGMGIGSGEIINKVENNKLKFTALGNLIPSVKRLAESSDEQILLTKDAYERAGQEVKTTKHGEVYEVRRVLDSEKNKVFIDNFLKRISQEKK